MNDYQPNINIEVQPNNEKTFRVVKISGNLDKAGLTEVKDKIEEAERSMSAKFLVFDFSGLNFINSEGIGFFLALYNKLIKDGKKMIITGASENVKDVLNVIGLMNIIDNYASISEMEESLKS